MLALIRGQTIFPKSVKVLIVHHHPFELWHAPPWLRVTARDPVTLKSMPEGSIGLLTFFDLANVGSVSAVMTEDLGWVERGCVRVLGRTASGEPRGCALGIGQFASAEAML